MAVTCDGFATCVGGEVVAGVQKLGCDGLDGLSELGLEVW